MDKVEMMRMFIAVARTSSFTKAGSELNVATQTVSKYVKALEDDLDVQLFDRTTRKVTLNSTGKAYFERCIDLLDQFDDIEASVKSQHGAPKGNIKLSAPTSFGELHVVPALRDFQQANPGISFEVDLSNRKVAIVEEGFDIVIRIGQLPDSSMVAKKLTTMRVSVYASPDYLDEHGWPRSPEDLSQHRCIIDSNLRRGRYWPFIVDGKELKVEVSGSFHSNSPNAVCKMALAGFGIGLSPMYIISQHLVSGRLVTLFDKFEAYQFGVYAIYPHRKHLSTRVRTLVDFLAARFRQMS